MPVIQLKYCRIAYTPAGCTTFFPDGTSVDAIPHPDMPHYSVVAHRCGYQDDLLAYCREHEVCHAIVAEWFTNSPSDVLWQLAHGKKPKHWHMVAEEMAAQTLQRFVRAHERPIISGVLWDDLHDFTLDRLAQAA